MTEKYYNQLEDLASHTGGKIRALTRNRIPINQHVSKFGVNSEIIDFNLPEEEIQEVISRMEEFTGFENWLDLV